MYSPMLYSSSKRLPFSEIYLEHIRHMAKVKKGHTFIQRRLHILGRHERTIVPMFIVFVICDGGVWR